MIGLVRSAIVILYPQTPELPGAEDCDLDAFLERFRAEAAPIVWIGVVAGAILFHLTPLFTVLVPLPAAWLPRNLADRHAQAISGSPIYLVRQSIFLVKLAAGLCWGAAPRVRGRFALQPLPPDPGTWRVQ
jgi:hypothetical protein